MPKEREEIFSPVEREKIGGVILLSVNRHRTDGFKFIERAALGSLDQADSKLTNNHMHSTKEEALFSYNKRNYCGHITFDLTKPDPELTFKCITVDKGPVYSLTLKRSQLKKANRRAGRTFESFGF